ncbi:MAG: S-layer homology domain-containing protein [Dysosmobacter sp.]|nr:S-layer homology domain-containing protein [Dysosmobacter sp.]
MKKTAKKLLSMALAFVMVLSLLPAMSVTALAEDEDDSGTKDAFGISMTEWTQAEKQQAESELPFGTGYGTWTTLLEKNELYFTMGYDGVSTLTGTFDWNEKTTETGTPDDIPDSAIGGHVINLSQDDLTGYMTGYKAATSAPVDIYGTGKKEYVAHLVLTHDASKMYLFMTDSNYKPVLGNNLGVEFTNIAQLGEMKVHQINGAFSIAAGDFDGDGRDTVVVYIPRTGSNKETKNGTAPFIAEYTFGTDANGLWGFSKTPTSTVCSNVLQLLGNNEINKIDTMKNQPMVDLVAEDVDKDGFDELIVTAGMNDVTNSDNQLQSQVFIYDRLSSKTTPVNATEDGNWHLSYHSQDECNSNGQHAPGLYIREDNYRRVVWASSTVGNIEVSTGLGSVDYPEIITAGFIDGEQSKTQHINVDGSDNIGVTAVRVDPTEEIDQSNRFTITSGGKSMTAINVICQYEEILNQKLSPNNWTKGGFYEDEDVNGLLQVQAYADRGLEYAEAVFISGTVYHLSANLRLEEAYRHTDFGNKDCGAGSNTLTNTTVATVTAGNFNGNDDGREQLIFVTSLKQSGKNNAYSRVYCYYYDTTLETKDGKQQEHGYEGKRSSYLTEHKGSFYVSLNALDTDNDSVIAKLDSITREYAMPDVLAILESTPYFTEIGDGPDGVGNSETVYGKSIIQGDTKSASFGFTVGLVTGFDIDIGKTSGVSLEVHLDHSFNWTTTKSKEVEWGVEFKNDTGENLVVVYRCPVIVYHYVDLNGNELVVGKSGQPAYSMVTVDEYNEAAEQFGLEEITDENAKLATPGEPSTYRSTDLGLSDANVHKEWVEYPNQGTTSQYLTYTTTTEKAFEYEFNLASTFIGKIHGFLLGFDLEFTTAHSKASLNGKSVTKSGSVNSTNAVDGYSFQWKFATWDCQLNGSTVPVIGYLVKDVSSPPSPAMGLTAETTSTDSVTLRWAQGTRLARQYRIYRVLDTSDTQYVLVGAVQGDQTTCTLTGLEPGETYTYVVRGVGYVGGEALESVDSAPITVRTQSEGSKVRLNLVGESLTSDNILQSTGAQAKVSMQVSGTDGGSISYQWQVLESTAEGRRKGWYNADKLDDTASAGETKLVGTVTGAKSGTLTLNTIDKSLNGSSLRCVVTITTRAGNVAIYYSPSVTLDLNGLDTATTITVAGAAGNGDGNITDPYTGTANYTQVTKNVTTTYVPVPVTVEADGKTYTIYQDETDPENPVYVGVYDTVNTVAGTTSRTYHAVTKNGETFTVGAELTLSGDRYVVDSEGEYTIPADFTGSSIYEDATTSYYEKQYVVTPGESVTTLTEYWYNTGDGKYYTKNASGGFVLAAPQPDKYTDNDGEVYETGADLRMAYYDANGTVILGADGTDGYDHYAAYTYDAANTGYTLSASFHCVPGTMLKNGTADYADSTKLVTVTRDNEVENITYTSSPVTGTQLALSAGVKDSRGDTVSTKVIFTITNTDTGAATQFTAYDGTSTWTAPQYGLYRIEAAAAATATTKASSAVCYYLADDPNNDYRLSLWQGGKQVTNITYNGDDVTLKLEKRVYNGETPTSSWEELDSGFSYQVNDADFSGSSYKPTAAGSYLFSALVDGKTAASAFLAVSKIPITVRPTWDREEGNINTVPNFGDITLEAKDAQGNDVDVDDVMTVSCDLYDGTGIKQGAASGVYTVTPAYQNDTVKADFLSCYSVTISTDNIYYIRDAITVHFNAGENGEVYARYIDPSGTEFAFDNGSQISMDNRLKFVAEPADGWFVGGWTVLLDGEPVDSSWYGSNTSRYSNTLEITSNGMEALDDSGKKEITVSVAFTDQTHQITYSAGDNEGSLRAVTGTSQLTSGGFVAHNAAVDFTAEPSTGKMVEKWIVDGTEYKWDGTDALYRENTLALENISAAHDVQVFFTDAAVTNVTVSAEDKGGGLYTGATVTVTDAQGNTITGDALRSVPQSNALTFTVGIDNIASGVVKEWQTSTNGTDWTTVTGSGGQNSITVYEHGETLHVRVVIAVAQLYRLSWKVMEGDTEITDTGIANLVVKSGDVFLGGNGSLYAVNTPVEFTLRLDSSCYVVGWSSNVTPAADGRSAAMTLTDDTVVTVNVAKKPVVSIQTIPANDHGTVGMEGTKDGESFFIRDDSSYVDLGSDLTVTLSPDTGYEVGGSIDAVYTDGTGSTTDDKTFAISNIQTNQTIEPVWTEIPTAAVSHSVVDKNGDSTGLDGTLTMSVTRKGMSDYAFTAGEDGTDAVYRDSVVTFTATPAAGYKTGKWIVNGVEQSTAPTLTITGNTPANQTVQVQFDPVGEAVTFGFDESGFTNKATLSAVYLPNGSNTESDFTSGNKPTANGVITFTVDDLADGYEVEGWYVNSVRQDGETGETFDYDVTANVGANVQVKIIRSSYTVTFSGANGSVSAAVGGNPISSGDSVVGDTSVTFTAAPAGATGYTFDGWTVDGEASENTAESLTLTITKDTVVKASYTLDEVRYTVTYGVIGENGTLSVRKLDAGNTAAAGSDVVFTATPADGYRVKGWYSHADGTAAIPGTTFEQNSYTLENLLANTSVYVAFEPIPTYDITVTVTGLGAVTATVNGETAEITNNRLTVSRHDNVVLTAAPDAHQYLTGWTLDGADQGNGSMTLTLTDVTEAHTVTAGFAASQLVNFQTKVVNAVGGSLTAKAGYGETLSTIDASTGISIEKGKKVVLTVVPAGNYMVKAWTVNGVVQENLSNTLTIENLSESTVVTVEFETPVVMRTIPGDGTDYTISSIVKTPSDYGEANQIRDRGTVTFTVTPEAGRYLTELTVNGTDCLTSTGTSGSENQLTIRSNGDGSFTITVANVTKDIELTAGSLEFQTVQEKLTEVPAELADQFQTVDALKTALRTQVLKTDSNVSASQIALFDIVLKYTTDGITWVEADKAHFPAGGITVSIPYSDLGNTDSSYTFTVIHMFTTDMDGHGIGDTERITPTKTATGIRFTVTSLSPFAIGWSKYTAPSGGGGGGVGGGGGGGGGGGAAPAVTVTIPDSVNGKVTADNTGAEEGDTVTLTVEPDKGYTLETLTVTDKNGEKLELKDKGDGKYTFTMPASKVTVEATFMEDNSMLNFFVDVPAGAYCYDAVLWAAKEGITAGTTATTFSPNATCTRAQAVTFLWRTAGSPAPQSHVMPFTDVAEGSYYHDAVLWAVENGITKGTTDTTFSPNAKCTRAQIVTFLWRSQKSPASGSVNPFTDVAADAYYVDAVLWAAENGITAGTTATTFSPNNDCTRAQIVTFLYRYKK